MSETMTPALSAEQWKRTASQDDPVVVSDFDGEVGIEFCHQLNDDGRGVRLHRDDSTIALFHSAPVRAVIAVANAALVDSDPHKITGQKVALLREYLVEWVKEMQVASAMGSPPTKQQREAHRLVTELADALSSYLPAG